MTEADYSLVRIRDLHYSYPGGPEILRIPALDITGRGLIALTGPSGAGKSTLVELLAGTLQEEYSGSIEVLDREWKEVRRDADRQRHLRRIGFIPQDFGLLPDRTPRQMLEQDLTDSGVPLAEHGERLERALGEVGLIDLVDQRVASLSGGQGQRVAIARMLARDVDLVIADEPTANLDRELRDTVMALLRSLAAQVPVIVVTHDAAVAEQCDRTIILQPAARTPSDSGPTELNPRRHHPSQVPLLILAVLVVLGGAGAAITYILHTSPAATQTHVYRPFTRSGKPAVHITNIVRGRCSSGSEAVAQNDAWRCFSGNYIYDPCFSVSRKSNNVICVFTPWSKSGIELLLTSQLPTSYGRSAADDLPWWIQTASGLRCGFAEGATMAIGHNRANYACGPQGREWLWGSPFRGSKPWTIYAAPVTAKRLSTRVKIAEAWF